LKVFKLEAGSLLLPLLPVPIVKNSLAKKHRSAACLCVVQGLIILDFYQPFCSNCYLLNLSEVGLINM